MSYDTKGFEELMRNLENEQNRIDDFCKDCSIRIVSEVFKKAAKRSPVDTGTLRRGFTITDNLEMSKIGDTFKTSVTNNTSYADYVEFGHRIKNSDKFVDGFKMLSTAEDEVRNVIPTYLERRMKKEFGDMFTNG